MKRSSYRFVLITALAFVVAAYRLATADTPHSSETPARTGTSSDTARLDLDLVVMRVLERNPTIGEARATWSESQAKARLAGSLDQPMLDLMAAPGSFGSSAVDPAYRIGVTQPLPLFGQRGVRRRMGESEASAAGWDLRTVQLDLVHEARVSYLDYWRIHRAMGLNRELLTILPELRRVSLAKYSAGLAGQQEPLQIEAEIAMLDHEAVILERRRLVAVAKLNVLMHQSAEGWLPPPPDSLSLPDTTFVHADLAPRARALRPEMRAADARYDASREGVAVAGKEGLPETSVAVAYDRFWEEPDVRWTAGLTLGLPIWGRASAARAEARARLDASRSRREVVQDSIELQVATAAARMHEQAHDVRIARERMLPLAARALKASRASYEANRADFQTVLSSLRAFLTARLEADDSVAMLHEAKADLDRAVGELPSALQKEEKP